MDEGHKRRTKARWLIIGTVIAILAVPTAVIAAGGAFTDDDTSVFESDIEWLAEAGVTRGCNPPANTLFCPDDEVTRGQMAAFMKRFAGYIDAEDGTVAEAGNAQTLGGATAAQLQSKVRVVHEDDIVSEDGFPDDSHSGCATTYTATAPGFAVVHGVMSMTSDTDDDGAVGFISATSDGAPILIEGSALSTAGGLHMEANTLFSVSATHAFAMTAGTAYVFEMTTHDDVGGTADCRLITEIHPTSETIANPLAAGGDSPFGLSEAALAKATEFLGG